MKNEIEVMRVFRVPPRGQLAVEINGQRYENISEIEAANWRQLTLTAVGELIHFAGGYQALVDAGVAAPAGPPSSPPGGDPPLTPEEQQAQFLAEQQAQLDAAKASKPKARATPPIAPKTETAAAAPPLSLLEQIDIVLQKYVLADPELANRSIHLTGSEEGGVHVNVDGKIYENPRDIEDSRIKLAIKMALKEWESM